MIWHLFEIWLLALAAFAAGSLAGALIYAGVSRTSLARLQGALADRIGDIIDGVNTRFGAGPVWRPRIRRNRIRPSLQARRAALPRDRDEAEAPIEPGRPSWVEERVARPRINGGPRDNRTAGEPATEPAWPPAVNVEAGEGAAEAEDEPLPAEETPYEPDDRPGFAPMRPAGLAAPRNGVPDDLQRIRGVGRKNEELLNSLGIYHFGQIAAWTPGEVRWIGAYLAFPERIERDDWVGQATVLASGGDTGYVKAERRKERGEEE